MKHTPGPWNVESTLQQLIISDRGTIAAPWMHETIGAIESIANARLIAAAPDLLTALVDAVTSLEYAAPIIDAPDNSFYRETIAFARAAIAKATGGK